MKHLGITLLAGILLAGSASATEQDTLSLNGIWEFSLEQGQNDGIRRPDPSSSSGDRRWHASGKSFTWTAIEVPGCWAVQGFEEPMYGNIPPEKASTGHYRRHFDLPADWAGKRVLLHFDGVWHAARVRLNGTLLGIHESGYTGFSFDISRTLRPEANLLEVDVAQTGQYVKLDTYDDWSLGGIFRDVWLEAMPAGCYLEAPTVVTDFDANYRDADLRVKIMLVNREKSRVAGNFPSLGESNHEVVFTLTDADGLTVATQTQTIPVQHATGRELTQVLHLHRPQAWNAEHPYLYRLTVELRQDGQLLHSRSTRVGFREMEIQDGQLLLNGQAIRLRGVNRHDEHPDVGRATRREHWLQDLRMMKDANINYVRCSHYTPARGFVELCDSLGMYLSNEVTVGYGDDLLFDEANAAGTLLRAYETVQRDLNAPSILFWTIGNEDPLAPQHLAMARLVRGLDPTRPMAMPWRAESWMPDEFQILAPHYWQPDEYEALARENPDRPIVTTEYTHAYGLHGMGGLEARWKALMRHPNGTGGAVWMWQDQGIRTPVLPARPSEFSDDPYLRLDAQGWDGIVDADRHPTRDLEEVKAVYAQVYPAVDKVKAVRRIRIPIVNEFDFSDLSGVRILWEQFADGVSVASGETRLKTPAHRNSSLRLHPAPAKGIYENHLLLTFLREDGSEITRRSVELQTPVRRKASELSFDPLTFLNSLRPVVWHSLDRTEGLMYSREERAVIDTTDFSRAVEEILVTEDRSTGGTEKYYLRSRWTIDANNSFLYEMECTLTPTQVHIDYTITPELQLSWIPCYGIAFQPRGMKGLRYVGLGPQDAWPNKKTAPTFGLWTYESGVKAVREVLVDLWEGTMCIEGANYLELDPSRPDEVMVFGNVVSRPEKGRKAVAPFPLLRTAEDAPFRGSLTFTIQ